MLSPDPGMTLTAFRVQLLFRVYKVCFRVLLLRLRVSHQSNANSSLNRSLARASSLLQSSNWRTVCSRASAARSLFTRSIGLESMTVLGLFGCLFLSQGVLWRVFRVSGFSAEVLKVKGFGGSVCTSPVERVSLGFGR